MGVPLPAGSQFMVNLYYHVTQPTVPLSGTFVPLGPPVILFLPGRFNGGNRTTPLDTAPGERAWFDVRVWESAFGSSWEGAVSAPAMNIGGTTRRAITSYPCPFNIMTGIPAGPLPITQAGGFAGLELAVPLSQPPPCIPEPGTVALIGVGLLALGLGRPRK